MPGVKMDRGRMSILIKVKLSQSLVGIRIEFGGRTNTDEHRAKQHSKTCCARSGRTDETD